MTQARGFDLVGRVLGGRYRLRRGIGLGGMGAVYEAEQLGLARPVAVKLLFEDDPRSIARFRQEALSAGAIRSPHVVSVIDFHADPGEPPFVVMELLEGEALSTLLARERALPFARAARIASQMLAGLDAAHRANMVHRDVKPSNVWLSRSLADDVVKLLDFGLVKPLDEGAVHTTAGVLLGTPAYLAPEQVRGWPVDPRTDVHAVGVVLFEMLTGRRAFTASTALIDILERALPPVSSLVPGVPLALSDVVARAVAKEPAARFGSAAEMLAALAPFTSNGASALSPSALAPTYPSGRPVQGAAAPFARPPPGPRSGSGALFFAVSATVLSLGLVGVGGAYVVLRDRASPPPTVSAPPAEPLPAFSAALPAAPAEDAATTTAPPGSRPASSALPAGAASPTPEPAGRAAPRPRGRGSCLCLADISPSRTGILHGVCPTPSVPLCTCVAKGLPNRPFCSRPWSVDRACSPADSLSGRVEPGKKQGEACAGYLLEGDGQSIHTEGTLECDLCYGDEMYGWGAQGAPCRGVHKDGRVLAGRWSCDAR